VTLWLILFVFRTLMKKIPETGAEPLALTIRLSQKSSLPLLPFLLQRFPYHTEGEWVERIQGERVLVNDRPASEGQPLRAGDEIRYLTPSWVEPEVDPNYRVFYEDDHLLAVSKPSPLPVHSNGAYFRNTLMNLLRKDRPEARDFHLVNRLDGETSGIVLMTKGNHHLKALQEMWGKGEVRKSYRAIVFGKFDPPHRRVDAPIGSLRDSKIRMKLGVNMIDGKDSVTEFERLGMKGIFSLVEARPLTGRTHQIRVHLETLGYPIVGDKLYSGNDETFLRFVEEGWTDWLQDRVILPRMALHAFRLELKHPATGQPLLLEDPFPESLSRFWEGLRPDES